ncbi:MAG: type IX secretion system membrane protein PorP/SprF [Flavobacteriales bacterium]|nr:type IX secretion system membrane protein PorP/SprF [Flavobacteriales bacterium]
MKRSLIVFVFGCLYLASNGQQDPQFTQWMFDKISFNPAAAGLNDMHCISAFARDQWDGFDKDPKTFMLNYEGFQEDINLGIGFTLYGESLGQERNTVARVAGAYRIPVGNGDQFQAGVAFGLYNKKLGNDWIAIDPVTDDPVIPNNETADNSFDMSLGVVYQRQNEFYAGLSMTHLTGADLDQLSITMARHLYFMGGYNFPLTGDLTLRTNLLAKTDFNASIFDVNANVLYQDMLWAGLSFRPGDALAPMVGYQYSWEGVGGATGRDRIPQKVMVGYSYDVTTSEIKNYSDGSHELFVTYCFNIIANPLLNKHANPRFL